MSLCQDPNGNELAVDTPVFIEGVITSVDDPIDGRCKVTVTVTKKGELTTLEFFAEEVKKLDTFTINGNINAPG